MKKKQIGMLIFIALIAVLCIISFRTPGTIADSWNVGILVFLVMLGIFVSMLNKAGGSGLHYCTDKLMGGSGNLFGACRSQYKWLCRISSDNTIYVPAVLLAEDDYEED